LICQDGFSGSEIELKTPDPLNVGADVLRFLYTGEIQISKDSISTLLRWAEDLNIVTLKVRVFAHSTF
jgi:hypothetical protein